MRLMTFSFKCNFKKVISCLAVLAMVLSFSLATNVTAAQAANPTTSGVVVNVIYNGTTTQVANYSIDDLASDFTQYQQTFSSIDNLKSPVKTVANGPYLSDVLNVAIGSGNKQYITNIAFAATDNYSRSLTYSALTADRYYYANLVPLWDYTNHVSGANTTANNYTQVYPMLAIDSFQSRFLSSEPTALQDRLNTVRFCYGQIPSEVTSNINTTNNFNKCVQTINVTVNTDLGLSANGATPAPTLAGSYQNGAVVATAYGSAPSITFTDNDAWKNAVTAVYVDDTSTSYSLASGSLTINDTSLDYGTHQVKVTADGYQDDYVTVVIAAGAPVLATSGIITQGSSAVISFADNPTWEDAITDVKVDGQSVTKTLDKTNNTITITAANGGWTSQGGYFYITVEASNFLDGIPTTEYTLNNIVYKANGQVVDPAYIAY